MREAIATQSLAPFEAPYAAAENTDTSLLGKANAIKAARHGLAGLVTEAWADDITTPYDGPQLIDGVTLKYAFSDSDNFPPTAAVRDFLLQFPDEPGYYATEGEATLKAVRAGLHASMLNIIATGGDVHGIAVKAILETTRQHVLLARRVGADTVPDAYLHGASFTENFYPRRPVIPAPEVALPTVAENPLRFSQLQIMAVLRTDRYLAARVEVPTPVQTSQVLSGLFADVTRASQRHDGTSRSVDAFGKFKYTEEPVQYDPATRELSWFNKHADPAPRTTDIHLLPDEDIPYIEVTDRQKCPFGYTEKAADPMPAQRVYGALLTHMAVNGQLDPHTFSRPISGKRF